MILVQAVFPVSAWLRRRGTTLMAMIVAACGIGAPGCNDVDSVGPVTQSSLAAIEEGKIKVAAGDYAAARTLFSTAVAAGGLQPDAYCDARIQQATCAAVMGDFDNALSIVNELTQAAPDVERVNALRSKILSMQNGAAAAQKSQ